MDKFISRQRDSKTIEAEILEQVKILKSEALKGEYLKFAFFCLFIFHYSIY